MLLAVLAALALAGCAPTLAEVRSGPAQTATFPRPVRSAGFRDQGAAGDAVHGAGELRNARAPIGIMNDFGPSLWPLVDACAGHKVVTTPPRPE